MVEPKNWDSIRTFAATIAGASPTQTILPGSQTGMAAAEGKALADLAALGAEASLSARLEVLGTLGEGGMGIVRLGRQVALDRKVAIKELNEERAGKPRSVLKLLQEAWMAGSLEHPNIVPIYDIEVQAGGDPRIVMKRIEGDSWRELISEPDEVARRFGASDHLRWNLEVLMHVANAVRFAHDRGIVHLDLKPSNVMLGAFGEVYLVDWGLGMSLSQDVGGRFPRTIDVDDIIGTPSYMAPEMLSRDGSRLSKQTDIFLLGAVLHEIACGRGPHKGESMLAILFQAATVTPSLPDEVPEELRAIAGKAMAMDPADRFASADEFRLAIRDFLEHRGSAALSDRAAASLDELKAAVAAESSREEVHRAFNEARFGFRQALASWSDNEPAKVGLHEATTVMIEFALAADHAPAAAALLGHMASPTAGLVTRVNEAMQRHANEGARIKELEKLGDDMDLSLGRRTRLFVLGILALLFIAWPVYSYNVIGLPSYQTQFRGPLIFLCVALALGIYARESMSRTLVNQRLYASLIVLFVAQIVLTGLGWFHQLPQSAFASLLFFMWALGATFATLLIERRLWPTALAQMISLVAVSANPQLTYFGIVSSNVVFLVNIVIIWWPGRMFGTYDGDARVR